MTRRIERVNSIIREEISELLRREAKDPRIGDLIAVTEVVTSPDMKYARVFVSHIGTEEQKQETISALTSAAGFLRIKLGKRLYQVISIVAHAATVLCCQPAINPHGCHLSCLILA